MVIVGNKGKWQLYKASCLNVRHIAVTIKEVAVTCCHGTSVVRNLKFLTPFFNPLTINQTTSYYLQTVAT